MITVLYTANNGYLPYLGISLISLLQNNKDQEVRVYVVLLEAQQDNLNRLKSIKKQYSNFDLRIIDGAPYVEKMKIYHMLQYRQSYAPNLRLFWEDFIDEDVDKILYLDSDTIIDASLDGLFNMKMDKACAVVLDSLSNSYKKCLGLSSLEPYFNSGVLLINVSVWRKKAYTEKFLTMLQNPEYVHVNIDQDYLNLLLRGDICVLSPKYNLQPHHMCLDVKTYYSCFGSKGYYSVKEIEEAVQTPVIVHTFRFCGKFPWHKNNVHPALKYYMKYKKISPWQNIPDEKGKDSLFFKTETFLYRYMPKKIYFSMWSFLQRKYFRILNKRVRRIAYEIH